jgi:hypothetical protein
MYFYHSLAARLQRTSTPVTGNQSNYLDHYKPPARSIKEFSQLSSPRYRTRNESVRRSCIYIILSLSTIHSLTSRSTNSLIISIHPFSGKRKTYQSLQMLHKHLQANIIRKDSLSSRSLSIPTTRHVRCRRIQFTQQESSL